MSESVKVVVVPEGSDPYVKEIEPDEEGSYLDALQHIVGGYIEAFDVLFDGKPSFYVNEEGLSDQSCGPNRAVYANDHMERAGYLSQMDFRTAVRKGDLYAILFGDFVAVAFDEEGCVRDLTPDEIGRVMDTFSGEQSITSGLREVAAALSARHGARHR